MDMSHRSKSCFVAAVVVLGLTVPLAAQRIPHAQDKPPGPPSSPAEALAKMKVPPGFHVELVAAEPAIVNPVAMTFDERGRIWITESLEYPRSSAGPGRDRVKVLEDTDGDGTADKVTVFAEGLNIPSGIAVGHGGVWVANAPDILFLQDTDGDGRADKQEVVVTGFGRFDTHELPNSLTWGPDGWLYGLNGVFNRSQVKHRGREYTFTCALFRIHPRTRDFELFAEGTSNPWGVAWDNAGSAFLSACVIDHLWHLTETGYYHRQGGPYPPFTWKIESIVKHKHQKAAYCGIHFFDSDAYPAQYREKLYMGNIHGNCINVDNLQRDGATYFATAEPDFLEANDAWFMPVAQKTGPDGCLYVLDWYDQYHCYQDARRDPDGIERAKGRLYRVRYKDSPRAARFDLSKETDDQLIDRLHSPNVYFRDVAQRLLSERRSPAAQARLQSLVLDDAAAHKTRMHAFWALIGTGPLESDFHAKILAHQDASLRAWGVRAAGNMRPVDAPIASRVVALAQDRAPDVKLQAAIAARKLLGDQSLPILLDILSSCGDDKLIPHIVWQNLHPLLETHSAEFLRIVETMDLKQSPNVASLLPRVLERMLGRKTSDMSTPATLFAMLVDGRQANVAAAQQCLALLAARVETGELGGERLQMLRDRLQPLLADILKTKADSPLHFDAVLLAATWRDAAALAAARQALSATTMPEPQRLKALGALVSAGDEQVLDAVAGILASGKGTTPEFKGQSLAALGRLDAPRVAEVVLAGYRQMPPEVQARAIELLTQRAAWSRRLMLVIASKAIPADALNANQVRKLLATRDPELIKLVNQHWGTIREQRNPGREAVIADMLALLRKLPGDAHKGQEVFKKVCGVCHKMYGEGQEVGPDITVNGRSSFEQLLSNVFDPSLVIGAAYQARTVVTKDGRVLTGLVAEDTDQRIVLKVQGGKQEVIPRADIEETKLSALSLMPEELEKQLKPQELADLFAFLSLDNPPGDPKARRLPGAPR